MTSAKSGQELSLIDIYTISTQHIEGITNSAD